MKLQVRNGPFDQILWTLTLGLSRYPDFKVLDPVVVFNSVLVMHVLKLLERATKVLFHYQAMLKNALRTLANVAAKVAIFCFPPLATGLRHRLRRTSLRATLGISHATLRPAKVFSTNATGSRNKSLLMSRLIAAFPRAAFHAGGGLGRKREGFFTNDAVLSNRHDWPFCLTGLAIIQGA